MYVFNGDTGVLLFCFRSGWPPVTSLPTRVHLAQSPCSHMDLGSLRVIIDMPVEQVSWCGRCGWAGRIDGVPLFPISYYVDTVVHSWPAGVQAQTLRKTECFVKSCPSILFLSVSIRSWQRPVLYLLDETYGPCEGAIGISDDITLHGKGEL